MIFYLKYIYKRQQEREGEKKKTELVWVSKHVMKNSARQPLEKCPITGNITVKHIQALWKKSE